MTGTCCRAAVLLVAVSASACGTLGARERQAAPVDARAAVIARARVWTPTDVATQDLKAGPRDPGAFAFGATVVCDYLDKDLGGRSPKFACRIGDDDEVKVKFGGTNAEVYGEVLATRLLWALGFGADRMYPVNVICRGCPMQFGGIIRADHESRFDPAVIEREMPAPEWKGADEDGWSWEELSMTQPELGGSPRAHRDALKLLAVFMQHTDSKREQQRIVCVDPARPPDKDTCGQPFLMISDVGLTFGRANRWNTNQLSGVNLNAWRTTPVWKADAGCVGNLPKSVTGTLSDPLISEEGRRFLAGLLVQLSDRQLQDLFDVARVELRVRSPGDARSGFATTAEWVDAFKSKRQEIVDRRCA